MCTENSFFVKMKAAQTIEHGHLRQNVIDYFSDIARSSSRNKTKNNKCQTEKQYYNMFSTSVARSANFDLKFLSR
jgi:hypothetical protein